MNAAMRSELLLTPRPVAARDVRVTLAAGEWRVCWVLDGLTSQAFGPAFGHVADAAAAAKLVRASHGLDG